MPDDASAMREIARTLSDSGLALVQVPWRSEVDTDEDLSVTDPEERTRRFGQFDHVRYYGRDFDDRLTAAGVHARRLLTGEIFPAAAVHVYGLSPSEPIWICATSAAVAGGIADHLRSWGTTVQAVHTLDLLTELEQRNKELVEQNANLKNQITALQRPPVQPVPMRSRLRRKAGRVKRKLLTAGKSSS